MAPVQLKSCNHSWKNCRSLKLATEQIIHKLILLATLRTIDVLKTLRNKEAARWLVKYFRFMYFNCYERSEYIYFTFYVSVWLEKSITTCKISLSRCPIVLKYRKNTNTCMGAYYIGLLWVCSVPIFMIVTITILYRFCWNL